MSLMMLSHSICLSARRIIKLFTTAATLRQMSATHGHGMPGRHPDIAFLQSRGPIEALSLAITMRGSSPVKSHQTDARVLICE